MHAFPPPRLAAALTALIACAPPPPADPGGGWPAPGPSTHPGPLPPPTATLQLEVTDLAPGAPVRFTVTGAPDGATVHLLRGRAVAEDDRCPPLLGGECLDVADFEVFTSGTADPDGTWSLSSTVPATVPVGADVAWQAWVLDPAGALASRALAQSVVSPCALSPDPTCETVHAGDVTADEVWAADTVHHVTGDVVVRGGATLTIAAGARVVFDAATGLTVEDGRLFVDGRADRVDFVPFGPTPAPGAWTGLGLGSASDGSVLGGVRVAYAGGGLHPSVSLDGSDGTVVAFAEILDGAGAGLAIQDSTVQLRDDRVARHAATGLDVARTVFDAVYGDEAFARNAFEANGTAARLPADLVDDLDATSTFAGNDAPIRVVPGPLGGDVTWPALDAPYRLDQDLEIAGGDALTLEAGVTLELDAFVRIGVGETGPGALLADGSSARVRLVPVPGASGPWQGLALGVEAVATLRAVDLDRDLGAAMGPLLAIDGAEDVIVDDVLLATSGSSPTPTVDVHDATLQLTDTTVVGPGPGVVLDDTSRFVAVDGPDAFARNDLTGAGLPVLELPADAVGALDAATAYDPGVPGPAVTVRADALTADATWPALDVPYTIAGDVDVRNDADLTLSPGAVLHFEAGRRLRVGNNTRGRLFADAPTGSIVFRGPDGDTTPGSWAGIVLDSFSDQSVLRGVVVEGGGGGLLGAVRLSSADTILLDRVTVRGSSSSGVYLVNSFAQITDSTFADNGDDGVRADLNSRFQAIDGPDAFRANVLVDNGDAPLSCHPDAARFLDELSVYAPNGDVIQLLGGAVDTPGTWPRTDTAYHLTGNVDIRDGAVITLSDGAELRADLGVQLRVGNGSPGGLITSPGGTAPVTFTAFGSEWRGLVLDDRCLAADTVLDGAVVSFGGAGSPANLVVDGCAATLRDVTLTDSAGHGLCDPAGAAIELGTTTFARNALGDRCP